MRRNALLTLVFRPVMGVAALIATPSPAMAMPYRAMDSEPRGTACAVLGPTTGEPGSVRSAETHGLAPLRGRHRRRACRRPAMAKKNVQLGCVTLSCGLFWTIEGSNIALDGHFWTIKGSNIALDGLF